MSIPEGRLYRRGQQLTIAIDTFRLEQIVLQRKLNGPKE